MRPLVDFVHGDDLPWQPGPAGMRSRLFSADPDGGDSRFVELPANWSGAGGVLDHDEEVFVLGGMILAGGDRLTRYSYAFWPAGLPRPAMTSPNGAQLLRFTSAPRTGRPADPVPHLNLRDMPWTSVWSENFPPGGARKTLRTDPDRDEGAWVLGVLPHWSFPSIEDHDYSEEHYMLEGAIETNIGLMTAGSYLHHPPLAPHGPSRSRPGLLTFVRASGPFVNRFTPVPDPGFPVE